MQFVNRREFLIATGFVVLTGASGCLSNGENDNDTNAVSVDSRFSGEDCPSFRDTDETNCYHKVGTVPDVYLAPEQEAGNPAEDAMTFILHNDSDSAVWSTPLSVSWDLYKLIDDEWRLLTPFRTVPLVYEPLDSGGFHTWSLEMSNEVEIDGEPLELEPVGVEEHEREGDTVRVRMEGDKGTDGRVVYSARQVERTVEEDIEPMLPEIAAQLHPVRNTLYFFGRYDTEEVRFEGDTSLAEELSILRRASNIYTGTQKGSIIEVTEDGAVNDLPYRFRFLHDGIYYEIAVGEYESA
jgi:hypothetical protein